MWTVIFITDVTIECYFWIARKSKVTTLEYISWDLSTSPWTPEQIDLYFPSAREIQPCYLFSALELFILLSAQV